MVLLALFGAVMGQGVVWYTGQFYAQTFLEKTCNINFEQSRTIMLWAILFATPFFIFWGWLSDKIGRKWIMMAGMALAVFSYRPIFKIFLEDSSGFHQQKLAAANMTREVDEKAGQTVSLISGTNDSLRTISSRVKLSNGLSFTEVITDTVYSKNSSVSQPIRTEKNVQLPSSTYWKFIGLVFILILFVTMVYGPIAAFLVELFPTKIRYTSMSLPYHIGNGVFGGLVPFIGLLLTTTYPTDKLVGLWYPIGVTVLCLIIGTLYLRNKIDKNIND